MHSIHLGYSNSIDDQEFFKLLDPNPRNEQNKSDIELHFNCNYIRPGCFECYSRNDYKATWSEDLIRNMLPFEIPGEIFKEIDFSAIKILFFIESECNFSTKPHQDLKFISRIEIEKYLYEK